MKTQRVEAVTARVEEVVIPTYAVGRPNKNPMFLEKRVYQGSSGVVYPHPVIEQVADEKEDRTYQAVILENRYLKIMLLPEIGGRVQMALDKTNGYHFVYYNQVIKPALVGLTGPWISGGIEFNWPQHHRPSTFEPVDFAIEEHADGSKSVWLSEIERMFRTKGMAGFTLHPDRAYLEINVQLYNRTQEPQTFLWWANPAVSVNDNYQSVFPPDVHAVMDHGKRDVSDFPIATGVYYKMDYAPGTDISRYKNIPVPTSYMAYHSDFDFVGCYDHGRAAGMMHVANHHLVPGKKQWTWGNGDFGQAWDRHLTDEDGPYIELMCGAFTDNQPDFSWLQPGEEKRFTQIFMPYKRIGAAKNANRDAVINLELSDDVAHVGVYVTQPRTVTIQLLAGDDALFEQTVELTPASALQTQVALDEVAIAPQQLTLRVLDGEHEIIAFTPLPAEKPPIPAPATAARPPAEIASNEELFLNGLHLEQYRHATYRPEPYYEEALRRDPLDARCNNALGLLLYRRGKFAQAEQHFRKAIQRLTLRNPNPYDGEPFYNLGLALRIQGDWAGAEAAFYKAVWNGAWQAPGYFELARLAARRGDFAEAFALAEQALAVNGLHHQARHLQALCLRHLARFDEAHQAIDAGLALDRFNFGLLHERALPADDPTADAQTTFTQLMRGNVHNYIELALDYAHAGRWAEAIALLTDAPQTDPMVAYFRAWCQQSAGDAAAAHASRTQAAAMAPDYCFPHRLEAVPALEAAMAANPDDARAPYYLGNFWYAHRRHAEAIACWEQAAAADPDFPTVQRNLALAYVNKQGDVVRGLAAMERAFALDPSDARVFFELDQLYKKVQQTPAQRLTNLDAHLDLVQQRDDLVIERVALLNLLGRHADALDALMARRFHPWEGGEGKVTGQYVLSHIQLAKAALAQGAAAAAIRHLEAAQEYPHNLGEGKLHGAQENQIFYFLGLAYKQLGQAEETETAFRRAAMGLSEPTSAMFYNDQPPDMIFYQGLAQRALGNEAAAAQIFRKLADYGAAHMDDDVSIDYFAVSLPDFLVFDEDLTQRNQIHCHYMLALGRLGLGKQAQADAHFAAIRELTPYHAGAVLGPL